MDVEDQRIGKLANVIEAAFSARAFGPRNARLPERRDHSCSEADDEQRASRNSPFVPADELAGAIGGGIFMSENRQARQIAASVLGELIDGGIASPGLFSESLQDDNVQIALQNFLELSAFFFFGPRRFGRRRCRNISRGVARCGA